MSCFCDDDDDYDEYIPLANLTTQETEYDKIKKVCHRYDTLWEDPDFKPDTKNLYQNGNVSAVLWKRPHDITSKPMYTHQGADFRDVDQGELGNCWFLSSVVCLASSDQCYLLNRVVPQDQGFEKNNYCGAFRFRFYYSGKWIEVVVDDRLPTRGGNLIYACNRSQRNEYWLPLLEKAYAKLCGGYHKLHGGFVQIALENLTGGAVQSIEFKDRKQKQRLTENLNMLWHMNCVITAIIVKPGGSGPRELKLPSGLYAGHAYSIVDVTKVDTMNGSTTILHIRNPWGKGEWNGAWSDGSKEWNTVLGEDRKKELEHRDDGEFWMSIKDFTDNFWGIAVAFLPPNEMTDKLACNLKHDAWHMKEMHGKRDHEHAHGQPRRHTAQQNKKLIKSMKDNKSWYNPQVMLTIPDAKTPTHVLACLTENCSVAALEGRNPVNPVTLLKQLDGKTIRRVEAIHNNASIETLAEHPCIKRNVHFAMDSEDVIIIPCFIEPDAQAEFHLRVFCEKDIEISVLKDPVNVPAVV